MKNYNYFRLFEETFAARKLLADLVPKLNISTLTTDRSIPMKSMMRYAIYKHFGAMILKRCHSILDISVDVGYSYFHVIFFYVVNSTSSRPFSPYFHECNY
jgi:hypothetical protein